MSTAQRVIDPKKTEFQILTSDGIEAKAAALDVPAKYSSDAMTSKEHAEDIAGSTILKQEPGPQVAVGVLDEKSNPTKQLSCTPMKTYFKMDNDMYWTSTPNGIKGQYERDQTCVFEVCLLSNGKVEIKDYQGNFLRPATGYSYYAIHAAAGRDENMFQFELQHENDKVFFRACNALFLSRIYYIDFEHTVEARKETRDVFCLFQMLPADP